MSSSTASIAPTEHSLEVFRLANRAASSWLANVGTVG